MLDLAERQRHAFLVEQVAQGKVLSPAQVRELAGYEERVPEPRPPLPPRPAKQGAKVSLAEVKALGLTRDSLTEAAAAFSGPGDLEALIAQCKDVRQAWERGRLLRGVRQLARTTVTVSQAGKELGICGSEFRKMLDTDAEVGDLWDQQRRRLRVKMAEAMVAQTEEGRPNALRYVENFLCGDKTRHFPGILLSRSQTQTEGGVRSVPCSEPHSPKRVSLSGMVLCLAEFGAVLPIGTHETMFILPEIHFASFRIWRTIPA